MDKQHFQNVVIKTQSIVLKLTAKIGTTPSFVMAADVPYGIAIGWDIDGLKGAFVVSFVPIDGDNFMTGTHYKKTFTGKARRELEKKVKPVIDQLAVLEFQTQLANS